MAGDHTLQEILEQPAVWQRVYETIRPQLAGLHLDNAQKIAFVGCGSSYYLAEAAGHLFAQISGCDVSYLPASEVLLSPYMVFKPEVQLAMVLLSRSGTTSEVLRAGEIFQGFRNQGDVGGRLYGLTCTAPSPMEALCDRVVIVPSREESHVMTQGFTASLLTMAIWASAIAPDHWATNGLSVLDGPLADALDRSGLMRELASYGDIKRFLFLGSGMLHAVACEGALKLQEMALEPAVSALPALEVRHGRMGTIDRDTLVVMCVSQHGASLERVLLAELKAQGARTLVLCGDESAEFEPDADYLCSVGKRPDLARALLYLPHLQLLAYHRAMRAGLDPDRPRHVARSVIL